MMVCKAATCTCIVTYLGIFLKISIITKKTNFMARRLHDMSIKNENNNCILSAPGDC